MRLPAWTGRSVEAQERRRVGEAVARGPHDPLRPGVRFSIEKRSAKRDAAADKG